MKAIFCRDKVNARLVGEALTGALDTWTSMVGSILFCVVTPVFVLCFYPVVYVFLPRSACVFYPAPHVFLVTSLVHIHRRHVHGPHLPLY